MSSMNKDDLIKEIINKPKKLSDDQKRAVLAKERYLKVVAGAGAGKTETLTRRIAYLLLVEGAQPNEIVAFTFTEKAAQSMKDRIYQRVGDISGPEKTVNLGEMYIGTIHGFAKRILDDYFGYGNYDVLDENQEVAFLMRYGWDLRLTRYGRNYVRGCLNFLKTVNMVWDEMLDREELPKKAPKFYESMERYEKLLEDHKQLTFGRMMHLIANRLHERPDLLSRIKYLIVDEYQDINQAQAVLIETIGKKASVFVVGDPRQSIYQWRGSDESFFRRFSKSFKGAREISIKENRRSTKAIVENANRFARSLQRTRYKDMDPIRLDSGFVGLAENETPEDEAKWIAEQIQSLINENKLSYADIGVLMRSVSTSAAPLLDELRERRIPFLVGGKVGLFRRDEAKAVGKIFAWLYEEGFWVEDTWNWEEQITGDALLDSAVEDWTNTLGDRIPDNLRDEIVRLRDELYRKLSPYKNFTGIYKEILKILGFYNLDYTERNDAAMMANLGRFNELLTDYETANRLGGRTPKWERDMKGLCWFLNSYAIQAYEEGAVDDIRGVDAVQIMTVHQAKGLEWPIVFLTSMVGTRFPSRMVGREQNWCGVPRNMFDVKRYEGTQEDERRLFYVAITRARDALVVSYFERINRNVSRSMFLDNMALDRVVIVGGNENLPKLDITPVTEREEMQTFSAGEIITYNQCPHLYLLGNIWGYQPGLHPKLGYGNSLHHCLRCASELVKKEGYNPLSAIATAVENTFHMPFVGGEVLEDFKRSGKKTLMEFARKQEKDFGKIEEVEYRLEFPIQGATITGRVDVILKDEENLEVREYKTSEEAKTFEESSIQVRLYVLGLRSLGRPITEGTVAYLEDANIKNVSMTNKEVADAKARTEETVRAIMEGNFTPNVGERCDGCDHKEICRWGCSK